MTTAQVIGAFLEGRSASNGRISTDGTNLYSYSTIIAYRRDGETFITQERYSITTTRHVSELRRALDWPNFAGSPEYKEVSIDVEYGSFPYAGQGNRQRMIDKKGSTELATFYPTVPR